MSMCWARFSVNAAAVSNILIASVRILGKVCFPALTASVRHLQCLGSFATALSSIPPEHWRCSNDAMTKQRYLMGQVKRLHVTGARGISPTSYIYIYNLDVHNPYTLYSHGHTTCTCTHVYVSVYTQKKIGRRRRL
jgi:hypothetical protein